MATGGANDLIADVSFGSSSTTNNARTANSVDLLGEVPEGDFTIAAGESVGFFVGS